MELAHISVTINLGPECICLMPLLISILLNRHTGHPFLKVHYKTILNATPIKNVKLDQSACLTNILNGSYSLDLHLHKRSSTNYCILSGMRKR